MYFTGIGTAANSAAIIVCAFLGVLLRRGLPEKVENTLVKACGLAVVVIGLQMALKTTNILICVVSTALGAVAGELVDIENCFNRVGKWVGDKFGSSSESVGRNISAGFVGASLLFCPGAMAVVGSLQDGMAADPSILYAKALLDGIFSIVMAANLGIGVVFSAFSVAVYQGLITLCAGVLESFATPVVLAELSSVGGVMVFGIGLNLLKITNIKVANMIPSIIFAAVIGYCFV